MNKSDKPLIKLIMKKEIGPKYIKSEIKDEKLKKKHHINTKGHKRLL